MTLPLPRYLQHPTPEQLNEIYHLRVTAWAPDPAFDASQYPDGLFDELDSSAHHWIIEEADRIIAAARVAVVERLTDIPAWRIYAQSQLPDGFPIAYLSRLVIHPDYQKRGWSKRFDEVRLQFIDQAEIPLTICDSALNRQRALEKHDFISNGTTDARFDFSSARYTIQYRLHPKAR